MRSFAFAVLISGAAMPSWGDVLPAAATSVTCISGVSRADDLSACAIGGANGSTASVVAFPIVAIQAQAFSTGADVVQAFSALQYSFEVAGGTRGTLVPVTFVAELTAFASSPVFADGQASMSVLNNQGSRIAQVCIDTRIGGCPTPFLGQFTVNVLSGEVEALNMSVFAGAGNSLSAGSARAEADPLIFVDRTFPGADQYSILISPGVGNGVPAAAVPEPKMFVSLAIVLVAVGCYRRAPRKEASRQCCYPVV